MPFGINWRAAGVTTGVFRRETSTLGLSTEELATEIL